MLLLGTFVYGLFAVLGLLQAIHLDLPPHLLPHGILHLASNTIATLRGLLSSTSTLNHIAAPRQSTDLIIRHTTDLITRRTTDLIIHRTVDLIIHVTPDLDILPSCKPILPTFTFRPFPSPTKTGADTLTGSSAMMVIVAWAICGLVLAAVAINWNMDRTITRRQDTTWPGASPFGVFNSQCPSTPSVFGVTYWSLALLGFPSKTLDVPAVRQMHSTNTEDGVSEVIGNILGIPDHAVGTVLDMVDTLPLPPHEQVPQHDDILPAHPLREEPLIPLELVRLTAQTREVLTETDNIRTLGSLDMETAVVVPPKKPPPAAPPRAKPVLARRGITAVNAFLNPPSRKRKERAAERPAESGSGNARSKAENDTSVSRTIVPGITAIVVYDRTPSYAPDIAVPSVGASSSNPVDVDKADSVLARDTVDDAIFEETPELPARSMAMSMEMSLGSMSCRVVTVRRGKGKGKKAVQTMTLDEALSAAA